MENNTAELLQVKDLQKILGIGRDKCYTLMRSKNFPSVQIQKTLYVSRTALYDWLKNDKVRKYA